MKWTSKRMIFFILELVCWFAAPVTFIVMQYSTLKDTPENVSFKIGITGIVMIVLVLILAKKLLLNKYAKKLSAKIAVFETQIETETAPDKTLLIERAIRKSKIIESLMAFVVPFAILAGSMYVCWALEQAIVKLFGVFGFITISYVLGEVFSVCEIASIRSKHRRIEDEEI